MKVRSLSLVFSVLIGFLSMFAMVAPVHAAEDQNLDIVTYNIFQDTENSKVRSDVITLMKDNDVLLLQEAWKKDLKTIFAQESGKWAIIQYTETSAHRGNAIFIRKSSVDQIYETGFNKDLAVSSYSDHSKITGKISAKVARSLASR